MVGVVLEEAVGTHIETSRGRGQEKVLAGQICSAFLAEGVVGMAEHALGVAGLANVVGGVLEEPIWTVLQTRGVVSKEERLEVARVDA